MNFSPDVLAGPDAPIHVRLDRCLAALPAESIRYGVPRIDHRGRLLVGHLCPPCFHWWARGGIAVSEALEAAGATNEVRERYAHVLALDAAECAREMDNLDCGGAHLEGWTAPDSIRSKSVIPQESAGKARKQTRRQMREAAEVDLFAGVPT